MYHSHPENFAQEYLMSRSPKTGILSDFKVLPKQDYYCSSGIDKALIIISDICHSQSEFSYSLYLKSI